MVGADKKVVFNPTCAPARKSPPSWFHSYAPIGIVSHIPAPSHQVLLTSATRSEEKASRARLLEAALLTTDTLAASGKPYIGWAVARSVIGRQSVKR